MRVALHVDGTAIRGNEVQQARVAEAGWRMENWFTVDAMMDGIEAALRGDAPARERG